MALHYETISYFLILKPDTHMHTYKTVICYEAPHIRLALDVAINIDLNATKRRPVKRTTIQQQ